MASLVRRIERRIMRNAGMVKRDRPVILNGKPVVVKGIPLTRRVVADNDDVEYGLTWPRAIPAKFHAPSDQNAPDLLARKWREGQRAGKVLVA